MNEKSSAAKPRNKCMSFPRIYAIADADLLAARSIPLETCVSEWMDAGVSLIQYRNKRGSDRDLLDAAGILRTLSAGSNLRLILNDRADLALISNFDGVHVGQSDLPVEDARSILGDAKWVGISTHTLEQLAAADKTDCTYIAFGPVFPTVSKSNPDPVVGLEGLCLARAQTNKPMVAIGGITLKNCRSVLNAGADSVAIISALLPDSSGRTIREIAKEFLQMCG